jgi:hypothetical protein
MELRICISPLTFEPFLHCKSSPSQDKKVGSFLCSLILLYTMDQTCRTGLLHTGLDDCSYGSLGPTKTLSSIACLGREEEAYACRYVRQSTKETAWSSNKKRGSWSVSSSSFRLLPITLCCVAAIFSNFEVYVFRWECPRLQTCSKEMA